MNHPVAVIQARMSSTRLPGKVMMDIGGRPMLQRVIERVQAAGLQTVVATSHSTADNPIFEWCMKQETVDCYRGSEHDVLDRFYQTALMFRADPVVRITADCPLLDPDVLRALVKSFSNASLDYASVATGSPGGQFPIMTDASEHLCAWRYPDGFDAEMFSLAALRWAWVFTLREEDREHVTPTIWRGSTFRKRHAHASADLGHLRLTVDTQEDLDRVRDIYTHCDIIGDGVFGLGEILAYLNRQGDGV